MKVTFLPGGSHPRAQPGILRVFDLLRITRGILPLLQLSEPSYTKQLLSH